MGDEPGITRDRIYGEASYGRRRFEIIDTGGIIPRDEDLIPSEILRQARFALEAADHIIFLIDGRTEITGIDRELAAMLRKLGKPVTMVVNKIDHDRRSDLVNEFHAFGFEHVFGVSAEHKLGLQDLLEHVTEGFPENITDEELPKKPKIKIAIIGRPNVGKSTLLNTLTGQDRAIVSPIAGTTRDAVDETVETETVDFVFVDTAGIRRKGKTREMTEKLGVVMARRNIRMANVVLLVMDATEGVLGHDATVAGYAHEEGRAIILCVNKWDAVEDKDKKKFTEQVKDELKFLDYAPIVYMSAKTGVGVNQLLPLIQECFDAASKRIGTGELNRFAAKLHFEPSIKVYYITQTGIRPPSFILFSDRQGALHFSAERYLVNRLRENFGFRGTPIEVKVNQKPQRERDKKR